MKKRSIVGFTLIEILIALTILAIVGVLMAMGLRSAISTHTRIQEKSQRLSQLQYAMIIIERDLLQIINRPILDASSEQKPAILLTKQNNELYFDFTRAGFINYMSIEPRTTLQRVRYYFDGKTLNRQFWLVLDRVKETPIESSTLLSNINNVTINLIQDTTKQTLPGTSTLPIAIEIVIDSNEFGRVSRFIPIAGG